MLRPDLTVSPVTGQPGRPAPVDDRDGDQSWVHADPAALPGYALVRAGNAMNALFARQLATVGLRPHTFFVLVHLAREPALTSAELARRLEMTPQSMGALLQGLADAGWADRPAGARRGQRIDVRLTEAGRQVLADAGPVLAELGRPETMGLTAAEAGTLHTLLQRVLTALTTTDDPPRRHP
jgi:DNA-binding MarR family transcriptional regulator